MSVHGGATPDLDRLYREHAGYVAGFVRARMFGASERDVEDLTGDVFARACRYADRYREQGRERAWLVTIAGRRLIDRGRRTEARIDARRLATDGPGARATADAGSGRHVEWLDIRAALRGLSPRWRHVIYERFYRDVPSHETARRFGCSPENVRRMRRSALRGLRRLLRASGDERGAGRIDGRPVERRWGAP